MLHRAHQHKVRLALRASRESAQMLTYLTQVDAQTSTDTQTQPRSNERPSDHQTPALPASAPAEQHPTGLS